MQKGKEHRRSNSCAEGKRIPQKCFANRHGAELIEKQLGKDQWEERIMEQMEEKTEKAKFRISVRTLIEFLLRYGDIDNRNSRDFSADAMLQGGRIHRKIQKSMGAEYQAEVPLSYEKEAEEYILKVEGRADGIFCMDGKEREQNRCLNERLPEFLNKEKSQIEEELPDICCIDEIKTTYKNLELLHKPKRLHLAQAKCYAAIYALDYEFNEIGVRMTYVHRKSEEVKYFYEEYQREELLEWFFSLLKMYDPWVRFQMKWSLLRKTSIKELEFPFPYRKGQREVAVSVYRTIQREKNILLQAPTGVGKTISTVFPAVKAMGEDLTEKIFYVTAKTVTTTAAMEALRILEEKKVRIKRIVLTAKEKICPWEETDCNPAACERAKGHYDRVNEAIYDFLTSEDEFSREKVALQAERFCICPFEFALDLSEFCDVIIGDYNYVFDPTVRLKRYFSEGKKTDSIFLVDEAHNLVDRARKMYSADFYKEDVLSFKRLLKDQAPKIVRALNSVNKEMLVLKRNAGKYENLDVLYQKMNRLGEIIWEYMENHPEAPNGKEIMEFYFNLRKFLMIFEISDKNYSYYGEIGEKGFCVRLLCIHTANHLSKCIQQGRGAVFFSATMLPVNYYKELLGMEEEDYAVYIPSPFLQEKRKILIATDVTSRYSRRTKQEYQKIAEYLLLMTAKKTGNYMAFFPSFQFLNEIKDCLEEKGPDGYEVVSQNSFMREEDRTAFLEKFKEKRQGGLLALCVMGGIFSEGIDLTGDQLIGVAIIGTGIGQISQENDLIKEFFNEREENGFDYAYRFPGMNRVQQAAGRVIRTEKDEGIILLLDERFSEYSNRCLFPMEWKDAVFGNDKMIGEELEKFWRKNGTVQS